MEEEPITLEKAARLLAEKAASSRPKKIIGLLLTGEGGFERYHGSIYTKFWDGTGVNRIKLEEVFVRALLTYAFSHPPETLKWAWCTTAPEGYTNDTRWGGKVFLRP